MIATIAAFAFYFRDTHWWSENIFAALAARRTRAKRFFAVVSGVASWREQVVADRDRHRRHRGDSLSAALAELDRRHRDRHRRAAARRSLVLPRLGGAAMDRAGMGARARSRESAGDLRGVFGRLHAADSAECLAGVVRLRADRSDDRAGRVHALLLPAAAECDGHFLARAVHRQRGRRPLAAARALRGEAVRDRDAARNVLRLERRPRAHAQPASSTRCRAERWR